MDGGEAVGVAAVGVDANNEEVRMERERDGGRDGGGKLKAVVCGGLSVGLCEGVGVIELIAGSEGVVDGVGEICGVVESCCNKVSKSKTFTSSSSPCILSFLSFLSPCFSLLRAWGQTWVVIGFSLLSIETPIATRFPLFHLRSRVLSIAAGMGFSWIGNTVLESG